MTDRELLEKAARASGIRLEWDGPSQDWSPMFYEGKTYYSWNPLENDGDAFRLAMKLGIRCQAHIDACQADSEMVPYNFLGARETAMRRAIVRAAAAMVNDDE